MNKTFLSAFIGDSETLSIPLTRNDGSEFAPGEEYALIFTAKYVGTDPDTDAVIQKASGAGITVTGSTAVVSLVPDDTIEESDRTLVFDVQAQHVTTAEVRTVAAGSLTLVRDITRETTTSVPVITTETPTPFSDTAVVTHAATSKPTPANADEIPLADSAAGYALKKLTWANLKATLKTYFDGLYSTFDGEFGSISGTPTTLAGYGITDAAPTAASVTAAVSGMTVSQKDATAKNLIPGPYIGNSEAFAEGLTEGALYRKDGGTTVWLEPENIIDIAFMGDSITDGPTGDGTAAVNGNSGWQWPIFALHGQSLNWVLADDGRNFSTGGFTAEQIRDNELPEVIAAAPDVCMLMAGTNNLGSAYAMDPDLSVGAEYVWSVLAETLNSLTAAGIKPIISTITPDGFTIVEGAYTTGQKNIEYRQVRALINDLIRTRAPALGAYVCDWWHVMALDPLDDLSAADPGYLDADTTINPLHPGYQGKWYLGNYAAGKIAEWFNLPADFVIPASGDAGWKTPNPYLTGDVAGLATSFSTPSSAGIVVTTSKNADGSQRLICSNSPTVDAGTNAYWRLRVYVTKTDTTYDGQNMYGIVKFRPVVEEGVQDWQVYAMSATMGLTNTTPPLSVSATQSDASNNNLLNICTEAAPQPAGFVVLKTKTCTHPGVGGTRQLTMDLAFYGPGAVDVYVSGIFQTD